MILAITISLSNGKIVTYEMSNSVYSYGLFEKNGTEKKGELQIILDSENKVYLFDNDEKDKYRENDLLVKYNNTNVDSQFDRNAEEIKIKDFKGFKLERKVLESSNMVSYFIKIDEIDKLKSESSFLEDVAIVRDIYLFVYGGLEDIGSENAIIIDVKVEWKEKFSCFILGMFRSKGIAISLDLESTQKIR